MSNGARIAVLETTILNINSTLLRIDNKIDGLGSTLENKINSLEDKLENKINTMEQKIENKFDTVDRKFDMLHNRIWSNFIWLMSGMIGLAGLIAHAHHWV